jgi:hypothetical protein
MSDLKCTLCGSLRAQAIKIPTGQTVISCTVCLALGAQAHVEKTIHGHELDVTRPETFRNKPACSKVWLLAYFAIHGNTMTKH